MRALPASTAGVSRTTTTFFIFFFRQGGGGGGSGRCGIARLWGMMGRRLLLFSAFSSMAGSKVRCGFGDGQ